VVDESDAKRVCAVGSPGIGKTSTTPILIKKLLSREEDTTVVYIMKSGDYNWYYQFAKKNGEIAVSLFPAEHAAGAIDCLRDKDTYYIVDPGASKDNVNPDVHVTAKVIINASPDSRHWGGNDFTKDTHHDHGTFRYYPMWSLDELIAAAQYISKCEIPSTGLPTWVAERFRHFGGVPRHVFAEKEMFDSAMGNIDDGLKKLNKDHAISLALNKSDLDSNDPTQPESSLMGYVKPDAAVNYKKRRPAVISEYVAELVWNEYMGVLWSRMLGSKERSTLGHGFEAYVRRFLPHAANASARNFVCRLALEARNPQRERNFLQLPQCTEIRLCLDIGTAMCDSKKAREERVIFHSVSEQFPLVDFCFKDGKIFYAVQVTVATSHDSSKKKIKHFADSLNMTRGEELKLIYAVPLDRFTSEKKFATSPVSIHNELRKKSKKHGDFIVEDVTVMVIGIPNPGQQLETQVRDAHNHGGHVG
jgi:hypothetical protein